MAPKLPPPANTKAVFAGPAWSDTDKVLFAPAVDALTKNHATFRCVYSSGKPGWVINIGCVVIPGWPEGPDLRCAIAHRGISRFRARANARPGMTTWTEALTVRRRPSR